MTCSRLLGRVRSFLLLGALPIGTLAAQAVAPTDTARSKQLLFTATDAALAAGFVGVTVAMFPLDRSIGGRLANEQSKANRFLDRSATGFELISSPGAFVIGPALYVYGRYAHQPGVADLGLHGTEALIVGSGITGLLKGVMGRSRPFVTADTNPRDFKFLGGFSGENRNSFPSGHTTTAFAAAAAVTSEVQRMWPRYTPYVAPVMYGGATLVGLSRMYHNKHWASDVVLGAGIGTFSGLKVVRYSHAHPDNLIDRVLLKTSIVPDGRGGGMLAWSMPTTW